MIISANKLNIFLALQLWVSTSAQWVEKRIKNYILSLIPTCFRVLHGSLLRHTSFSFWTGSQSYDPSWTGNPKSILSSYRCIPDPPWSNWKPQRSTSLSPVPILGMRLGWEPILGITFGGRRCLKLQNYEIALLIIILQ